MVEQVQLLSPACTQRLLDRANCGILIRSMCCLLCWTRVASGSSSSCPAVSSEWLYRGEYGAKMVGGYFLSTADGKGLPYKTVLAGRTFG